MANAIVSKEITENIDALAALPIIGSMAVNMAIDSNVPSDFDFTTFDFMQRANAQYRLQKPEHKLVEPLTIGAVAAALAIRFKDFRTALTQPQAGE